MADVDEVKDSVIQELGHHEMRPTELLALLGKQYPDTLIKEVVLGLLREGRIEMSPNRQLRILADAA